MRCESSRVRFKVSLYHSHIRVSHWEKAALLQFVEGTVCVTKCVGTPLHIRSSALLSITQELISLGNMVINIHATLFA